MDNFILEIPNFLPDNICNHLIDLFQKDVDNVESGELIYHYKGKPVRYDKAGKYLNISGLEKYKSIDNILFKYILEAGKIYINYLKDKFDINKKPLPHTFFNIINYHGAKDRGYTMHKVERGKHYEWHIDHEPGGDDDSAYAFIQIIIYLNTLQPHEGGCTQFINGRKVRPEIGKILMFPRSWTFPHSGEEVKAEYKFIMFTSIDIPGY